jgi:S-formylglutathione hydrolase FrmB
MRSGLRWFAVISALVLSATAAQAGFIQYPQPWELKRFNAKLHGYVYDFTHNHGVDRRVWCPSLGKKRDMYVYVPPGYDGVKQYPLLIWLHGFSQDEKDTKSLAAKFDEAVACGRVPPMVIACPDGTFNGRPSMTNSGSFYLNGPRGRYEDYLTVDIWNFLMCNFAVRPEREAHVLAGASMGGTSAFNLGFKNKEKFGIIVGIMPLLDLLYADCHGNHFGPFDPDCLGRIETYRPMSSAGRLFGVINIRFGKAMRPVMGNRAAVNARIRSENPVEMLELYDIKPDDFQIFITYGARDQFSGANENQSFLYYAAQRGVSADLVVNPTGRHNKKTGMSFFDSFTDWLAPRLAPYVP